MEISIFNYSTSHRKGDSFFSGRAEVALRKYPTN